jgi:peptide/nickel transport system ATP-binding protein
LETPLVEIRNLSVQFQAADPPAVSNISFNIGRGDKVGIVGESGSGKTLTALSIIGLLPKTAKTTGEIFLHIKDEHRINLLKMEEKRILEIRGNKIGMVFQEPMSSLNPVMICGKQVIEVLMEHRSMDAAEARNEVLRLFEEVRLPLPVESYYSYPHQLSGGQRQRVMIAMAIACKPDLIIADEPTTALDVTVQKVILELLRSLSNKYGISVLFISHDLGVIASIADKLIVMYRGEIVEQGETEKIISQPAHPYTRGLLACRPPLSGKPQRLPTLKDYLNPGDIQGGQENKIKKPALSREYEKKIILSVSGLTTKFVSKRNIFGHPTREFAAVREVSFTLLEGETLGLVGESGCGKTSLGRSILQLIKAGEGETWYRGTRLDKLKGKSLRRFRKNLQIIFQDPYSSLNPGLTAGESIMEPMDVHGLFSGKSERKERTLELMEKVALDPAHFNRYPHQFSGGQRQRIGIARALAVEPDIIICDESVSALDVSVQAQILNLLNELKEDFGLTYIFISHDLAVVRYMSDRLMVMQNGEIVERGDPEEIFLAPEKEYTRKLLESIPRISPA